MIRHKPFSRVVIFKLFEVLNSSENWSKTTNLLPLKCMFRIYILHMPENPGPLAKGSEAEVAYSDTESRQGTD